MYIKVHVYPGMKREKITKISDNQYELILKEPAERNLANKRALEIVAEQLDVSPRRVKQVTGHRSPSKIFEILKDK